MACFPTWSGKAAMIFFPFIRPFLKPKNTPFQQPPSQKVKGCDLFIFTGERSGDLHGGKLLEVLHEKNPSLQVVGVGGPMMRSRPNFTCILPMEEFQVI